MVKIEIKPGCKAWVCNECGCDADPCVFVQQDITTPAPRCCVYHDKTKVKWKETNLHIII